MRRTFGRPGMWLAAAVALAGCSETVSIAEPDRAVQPPVVAASLNSAALPLLERTGPPGAEVQASATIGSQGGVLRAGGVELRIPKGALRGPTQIKMVVPAGKFVHAVFMPHGLEFRKEVELLFDLHDTNGIHASSNELIGAYFVNPVSSLGLVDPTELLPVTVTNGVLRMAITHFSRYAPTRRGYTSAGG